MKKPRRKLKKRTIKSPKGKRISVRYSGWFSPYTNIRGKLATTLPYYTSAKCGVYLIRSKRTKKILYIGHSGKQLYKTLYRHFQNGSTSKQYRATYYRHQAYEVMILLTYSCDNAFMLEQYYINKLRPRDGIRKLELPLNEIRFSGSLPNPPKTAPDPWDIVVPF